MGKWDVDFDDYEEKEGGYSGEPPKPGMYEGKLVELAEHTTSDDALKWVFEITEEGDFTGWRGWVYSNMSTAKWKTQQIAKALQGGAEKKISVDPDKADKILKAAKPVVLVVRKDTYDGEYAPKIGRILPSKDVASGKGKKGKKDPWEDED
jgi:hypothetical protein